MPHDYYENYYEERDQKEAEKLNLSVSDYLEFEKLCDDYLQGRRLDNQKILEEHQMKVFNDCRRYVNEMNDSSFRDHERRQDLLKYFKEMRGI